MCRPPSQQLCSNTEEDQCWICLGESVEDNPLLKVCACPRSSHAACSARWQLQSAGTSEETACRFCSCVLPDWRTALTDGQRIAEVVPYMAVVYNGRAYRIPVHSGPTGLADFKARVKTLFAFPIDMEFDVCFECQSPVDEHKLMLKGIDAFHAAAHCASISAARRCTGSSEDSSSQQGLDVGKLQEMVLATPL